MDNLPIIINSISTLSGVCITMFVQAKIANRNKVLDYDRDALKLHYDSTSQRDKLLLQKLELLHVLIGELGRECNLTFFTIDREFKLTRLEYHAKYRELCHKLEDAQMLADLYIPQISEEISLIDGDLNCYWGNFSSLLLDQESDEKVDHNNMWFKKAFEYTNSIPKKVKEAQFKIRSISQDAMQNSKDCF